MTDDFASEDFVNDDFVTYDAAYVLGALSPQDRQAFEQHLHTCARCSAAVQELAGLPGLLAQTRGPAGEGEGPGSGVPDLPGLPGLPVPGADGGSGRGSGSGSGSGSMELNLPPTLGSDLRASDSRSTPDLPPVVGPDSGTAAGLPTMFSLDSPGADWRSAPGLPSASGSDSGAAAGLPMRGLGSPGSDSRAAPGLPPVPGPDSRIAAGLPPVPELPVPGSGSSATTDVPQAPSAVEGPDAVEPTPPPSSSVPYSEADLPPVPNVPDSSPPDLLPVLMRKVRHRRRVRTGVTGGVAALAVAAGVALAVTLSLPETQAPPAAPAIAAPPPELPMAALGEYPIQAAARIDPRAWGTEVEMSCSYRGGKGGDYSLVALGRNGTETELATWKALPENTAKVVVGTPMKSGDIASLEIRSVRTGKPLMRLVYP